MERLHAIWSRLCRGRDDPVCPADRSRGLIAESTFDTSLDGWTSNTPSQISWSKREVIRAVSSCLRIRRCLDRRQRTRDVFRKLLGVNEVGTISFDHKIIAETGIQSLSPYEIDLSGPGGSATWTGATPKGVTGWVTLNAPLLKSDWTINSGTWTGLLANVTQLQIPIELVTNDTIPGDTDHEGVDNVMLSSAAPEPASLTLLGAGMAGLGGLTLRRRRVNPNVAKAAASWKMLDPANA